MRAMLLGEPLQDRRQQQHVDEVGVELGAARSRDLQCGGLGASATTVSPTIGDDVEHVGDRDDARRERDPSSAQASRIPAAVPSLMMRDDATAELRIELIERLEDARATLRMGRDFSTFRRGETTTVVNDIEERFVDLSDVVKERDPLEFTQGGI